MKKSFLYGCAIGLLLVFIFPWFFGGVLLCGSESNSWLNVTSRLYGNGDLDSYIIFGRILALVFIVLVGLVFIFIRYIKLKFTKTSSLNIKTNTISKSERVFRTTLIIILSIFIITIIFAVTISKGSTSCDSIPPAPGLPGVTFN
jgi:small-conductance mechanosensitive channel